MYNDQQIRNISYDQIKIMNKLLSNRNPEANTWRPCLTCYNSPAVLSQVLFAPGLVQTFLV